MSFKKGAFSKKEPERQKIRDDLRKKFFADLGLTPCHKVFAEDVKVDAQAKKMPALFVKAKSLHKDEMSALESLQSEFSQLDFGKGAFAELPSSSPNQSGLNVAALAKNFFYTYRD